MLTPEPGLPRGGLRSKMLILFLGLLTVRLIYLFYFSYYQEHIFSDMAAYWSRAYSRFQGDIFSIHQWTCWPAFPHILLALLFKCLQFADLLGAAHEAVLAVFAAASSATAVVVFLLIYRLSSSNALSWIGALYYGLSFPALYFNTYVLSENMAAPALAAAVYFSFRAFDSVQSRPSAWAGFFLAVASAARPNMLILVPVFWAAFCLIPHWQRRHWRKAAAFTGTLAGFLLLVCIENYHISHGQLRGLAGNGGMNFLIQQCQLRTIGSTAYKEGSYFTQPGFTAREELSSYVTDKYWHEQGYFFAKGIECIKNNPQVLLTDFLQIGNLFKGPFFPVDRTTYLFPLMDFSYSLAFLMILLGGMLFFLRTLSADQFRRLLFLFGLLLAYASSHMLFSAERRYFYPFLFVPPVLFFVLLPHLQKALRQTAIYLVVILLIWLVGWACMLLAQLPQKSLAERYDAGEVQLIPFEKVQEYREEGTYWNIWGNLVIPRRSALVLTLPQKNHAASFELSADHNDDYILEFYLAGRSLAAVRSPAKLLASGGLSIRTGEIPPEARRQGFDAIAVRGNKGDGLYSIGHLHLD